MSYRVVYTKPFLGEIDQHTDYLLGQGVSVETVAAWYDKLFKYLDSLDDLDLLAEPECQAFGDRFQVLGPTDNIQGQNHDGLCAGIGIDEVLGEFLRSDAFETHLAVHDLFVERFGALAAEQCESEVPRDDEADAGRQQRLAPRHLGPLLDVPERHQTDQ